MSQLAPAPGQAMTVSPFSHDRYTIKRKFWTFLGRDFRVLDPSGNLCLYVLHKVFTWKDEWNIFADERQTASLVRVKAREAIALNITHDMLDPQTNAWLGSVRSRGLKSVIRDAWDVVDQQGNVVGELKEDSNGFMRRLFPSFFGMPMLLGRWHLTINGAQVMTIEEERTFFVKTFSAHMAPGASIDRRFAIGCALLALMRELVRESTT